MPATSRQSEAVLLKLCVLALIAIALGRPINHLASYGLLAVSLVVVLTGAVRLSGARFATAALIALAAAAVHTFLPPSHIEEGHNVFLIDEPGSALERGLPREAYRRWRRASMRPTRRRTRCRAGTLGCWRPGGHPGPPVCVRGRWPVRRPRLFAPRRRHRFRRSGLAAAWHHQRPLARCLSATRATSRASRAIGTRSRSSAAGNCGCPIS